MAEPKRESAGSVGFVTVRRNAEHGYFGGYLIVNFHGRPLEFHCTLPVKPSRAQEILFGRTLDEFICGEQITKALIAKAKLESNLVFTDCGAAISCRLVCDQPIAVLQSRSDSVPTEPGLAIPNSAANNFVHFRLGDYDLSVSARFAGDEAIFRQRWHELKMEMDLHEPFERIAEALLEAHPAARAA